MRSMNKMSAEDIASAIIHQNHMHLGTRTSLAEMRSEGGGRLTGSAAAEQTLEHSQRLIIRHQFLDTHRHDVELRHGGGHIGITLVGANHTIAGGSHTKVAAGHTCSCFHKLVAQMMAGTSALVLKYPDGQCWILITNTSTWKGHGFSNDSMAFFEKLREKYMAKMPKKDLFI